MTITLKLPDELEQQLSVEAEKINLSLSEYIVRLLSVRQVLNNPPKTGAELINYWQKEQLINSRPEIKNSQEYVRQIPYKAEHRQHF